ncbi:MAG: MFS transporter [Lentisphaeria bacterium]|nr:MFS transporter [Lentisphaeria bacterium]
MDTVTKKSIPGWIILLLITPVYFFSNLQKVIIPGAVFDELQQMFTLDAAGVTRIGAMFLGVYAVSQLIIGVLVDRYGGARVIIFGGTLFCIGSILSAFGFSLELLYFSRLLTGFGAASIYLSMVKEIGRVAGSKLPLVLGVATIIGYAGAITGASPFIAGVDKFGYFTMVLGSGIIMTLFYLAYVAVAVRDNFPAVERSVKFSIPAYLNVFKSRQNVALMLSVGISFGTYFALQSTIGKKFLEDFCHLSPSASGLVLTVTMIIATVNGFIAANVSSWINNRRRPLVIFSGIGCLAGALLILAGVWQNTGAFLPVAGMIVMAFAGNIAPIFVAVLKESNPEHSFGTSVCVCNAFAYAVSAGFGAGAGKLMDIFPPETIEGIKIYGKNSYLLVFAVLAAVAVIAGLLSLLIRETYGKPLTTTETQD